MRVLYLYVTVVIMTGCVACMQRSNDSNARKLDSLITNSHDITTRIDSINIDSASAVFKVVEENNEFFKKNLNQKLDSASFKRFSLYGDFQKFLKTWLKNIKVNRNEVEFCRKQLTDLKSDYVKGALKDSIFTKYYDEENDALNDVSEKIKIDIDAFNYHINIYKEINPFVTAFRDSLSGVISH